MRGSSTSTRSTHLATNRVTGHARQRQRLMVVQYLICCAGLLVRQHKTVVLVRRLRREGPSAAPHTRQP
jgi:hypothetical protein